MPHDSELPASLTEVARVCREETEHFFRRVTHDTRFCYELFRRSLERREADAFELLVRNYSSLVDHWVRRHPGFEDSGEDASYFVNSAFGKLWTAIPPARFASFANLKALLRYLQLCVHSCIIDHLRMTHQAMSLNGTDDDSPPPYEPETLVSPLSDAERMEFWRAVDGRLQSEKERVVLHACFGLAMKPAEIPLAFPGTFTTVQEVYRTKQNVLERLRRDNTLKKYLAPYA